MKTRHQQTLDRRAASLKLKPRPRQDNGYMTEFVIPARLTVGEQFDSERRAHLQQLHAKAARQQP